MTDADALAGGEWAPRPIFHVRGARSSRLPPDDASPRGLRENLSPGLGRRSFLFDDAQKKRSRQEPVLVKLDFNTLRDQVTI